MGSVPSRLSKSKMAPLSHPRAQFVPINPDLDLISLVENTSNFDYVTRLPNEMLKEHSIQSLEQLVLLHVVIGGKPLVIEGWEDRLDPYLFSPEWLQNNLGKQRESCSTPKSIPVLTQDMQLSKSETYPMESISL